MSNFKLNEIIKPNLRLANPNLPYENVRGLANAPTKLAFKRLIMKLRPKIILVVEPCMSFKAFPKK